MVRLTIHIRPQNGYTFPGKIKTTIVDTSQRLEQIVTDLKLDTKKGITLFSRDGQRELALNTSLASNNIQNGDIIESCACPKLSAVLSACLKDLDTVQKLSEDERTRERIEPLLDLDRTLDPWPERWSHDSVKTRIIGLALIKKFIQRQDRYADQIVPQCTSLEELHEFLQESLFSREQQQGRRTHNSMAHVLKPSTRGSGMPSICWKLAQYKLDKIRKIMDDQRAYLPDDNSTLSCSIEAFLASEKERHLTLQGLPLEQQTPNNRKRRKDPPSSAAASSQRKRRRIAIESPSLRLVDQNWKCSECNTEAADSMCLTEGCPFHKKPSCRTCFSANHPPLRNHERVDATDPRAKAVLKALHKQGKQDLYCPAYGSGPFALLCTLYNQMKQGQHSLDETRLKELAQPICRSNLYDHQARGRNAFACMEALMDRNFVRKELLPGMAARDGKYSLLPAGEALAKHCSVFEQELSSAMYKHPTTLMSAGNSHTMKLLVDTREDATFAKRLMRRCQLDRVPCEKKELPAGDYLFVNDGKVCPVVVERKSWSDLADSVLGKGQSRSRLECVRLFENQRQCESGRCQLCKMKGSGCSTVMFVIEGARCENRDATPNKCTPDKRCQFCREIQQRHGPAVTHEELEGALFKLQVQHGCFVTFSRSYNETIETLLAIRGLLCAGLVATPGKESEADDMARAVAASLGKSEPVSRPSYPFMAPLSMTYEQFCSNARRRYEGRLDEARGVTFKDWDDTFFIQQTVTGEVERSIDKLASGGAPAGRSSLVVNLDESFKNAHKDDDDSVVILDDDDSNLGAKEKRAKLTAVKTEEVIDLDSDEESVVEILDIPPPRVAKVSIDDEVEVILQVQPSPATSNAAAMGASAIPTAGRTPQPTLLLLSGMYEYDMNYFKDLSALWKALYQQHQISVSSVALDSDDIRKQWANKIKDFEATELPLVGRQSILVWLLFIQIKYGIQVHMTRESNHKQRMEALLSGRKKPAPVATMPKATEPQLRNASPSKDTKQVCSICRVELGKEDIDVTPCMHCFHKKCLGTWLSRTSAGKHRCPMCNYTLDDFFTNGIQSQKAGQSASAKATRKPPHPGSNAQSEAMRQARLARLDTPSRPPLPRPRPSVANRSPLTASARQVSLEGQWQCSQCTLLNDSDADRCSACDAAPTRNWSCGSCTLENDSDSSLCAACGASRSLKNHRNSPAGHPVLSVDAGFPTTLAANRVTKATAQTESASRKRRITCGACGAEGHNRASATEDNCTKYWAADEIELRAKKKEKEERKAQEAREAIARHHSGSSDTKTKLEEARKALAALEKATVADGSLRENEVKRLRKQQARAEKRARKYD